jgi:hypothetical protein
MAAVIILFGFFTVSPVLIFSIIPSGLRDCQSDIVKDCSGGTPFFIARSEATKQSSLLRGLDCFAALAMTERPGKLS